MAGGGTVGSASRPEFNGSWSSGDGPSNIFENELTLRDAGGRSRGEFEFEACFSPLSSQKNVFEYVEPLIGSVIDGYNICLIAYGRTGAGKTYTMVGPHHLRFLCYF